MSVPLRRAAGADGLRAGTPVSLFRAPVGPVHGVALHHYIPAASGDRFLLDTLLEQPAPPRTTLLNRRALRDR